MNIKAIALVAILGLSAPAITDLIINSQALAKPPAPTEPTGGYSDNLWSVSIWRENNLSYSYSLKNYQTGATLFLSGVEEVVDSDRRLYTWQDGRNQYQIVWQPSQPRSIRLQVFAADGREILNRLLTRRFT